MARLKAALIREYEDNEEVHIEVHNPRNTEAVTLNFRGEKLAKVGSWERALREKAAAASVSTKGISALGFVGFLWFLSSHGKFPDR